MLLCGWVASLVLLALLTAIVVTSYLDVKNKMGDQQGLLCQVNRHNYFCMTKIMSHVKDCHHDASNFLF